MVYKAGFYSVLASRLDDVLKGHHLSRPTLYNKKCVSFRLAGSKYRTLAFSLSSPSPMALLHEEEKKENAFSSLFLNVLKKELPNAFVQGAIQLNGDRIIAIKCLVNDAAYQEKERTLVFEALPRHSNLILLDEEGKVIAAYRPSGLDTKRPIVKGVTYVPPEKGFLVAETPSEDDFDRYLTDAQKAWEDIEKERRTDLYGPKIAEAKRRREALLRKLSAFDKDEAEANKHINDGDIGNAFYLGEGLDYEKGVLVYNGNEYPFDPKQKISLAAEKYFKRAKKAKEALKRMEDNRRKALAELSEVEAKLDLYEEADIEELENLLGTNHQSKKPKKKEGGPLPRLVTLGGLKAYYGHSAKENDFLTFSFTKNPRFHWFHIKGHSGPHVVIRKEHISEEERKFALCLAVYASGRNEGEAIEALKGDVRKTNVLGQVMVNEPKTFFVKEIPENYLRAFRDCGVKR